MLDPMLDPSPSVNFKRGQRYGASPIYISDLSSAVWLFLVVYNGTLIRLSSGQTNGKNLRRYDRHRNRFWNFELGGGLL